MQDLGSTWATWTAAASGARTLLLSHLRGHVCDMAALTAVCQRHGVLLNSTLVIERTVTAQSVPPLSLPGRGSG